MNNQLQKPIDDPDSIFVAIDRKDTPQVISKLRGNMIQFDVSINPNHEEGEADSDVFWFWKNEDHDSLQDIINEALK